MNSVTSEMYQKQYASVFDGDKQWQTLDTPEGQTFAWDSKSTYVKHPPYFEGMSKKECAVEDIVNARVLVMAGDSVTTDHISPAGAIAKNSPAGTYLQEKGITFQDFNSYGSRRGNHEVMMRGTFANVRFRNLLTPDQEGSSTIYWPQTQQMSIFDAALRYQKEKITTLILAGKEYGTGSSRDWAAKGPALLGVRVVIAESYERIHRSNLIGMGILPLEYAEGKTRDSLGLTGEESFNIQNLADQLTPGNTVTVVAKGPQKTITFKCAVRLDTPDEVAYYQHGGILQYVLRQLVGSTQ